LLADFGEYNPVLIEITLGALKQFADEVVGEPLDIQLEFEHPETWGDNTEQAEKYYRNFFKCDVTFNSTQSIIRANTELATKRLKNTNQVMHKFSQGVFQKEMERKSAPLDFTRTVREILEKHADQNVYLDSSKLAEKLGVTPRTLSRKLAMEDSRFKELSNDVRFSKAKKELELTDIPIKQLADKLGFRNSEAFTRSFKVYAGKTPKQWRSKE